MNVVKMFIPQQMPAAYWLGRSAALECQLLFPGSGLDQVGLEKRYGQKRYIRKWIHCGYINFQQINVFPIKGIVVDLVLKHLQCNTDKAFVVLIVYLGGKTFKSLQVLIILTILKFKDES